MMVSVRKLQINLFLSVVSAACLLILFSELVFTGPDYSLYKSGYEAALDCAGCSIKGQSDIITNFFYAFGTLGFDFAVFLYVISLIALVVKLSAANGFVGPGWFIAFILYVTSAFWLQELIQLKLSLAFSVWLLAINVFFLQKRPFLSLLLICVSLLLHNSLVFFVVSYVAFSLVKIARNKKILAPLIFATIGYIVVENLSLLQDQLSIYLANVEGNRLAQYLYDFIFLANESKANLFNMHLLDVILTCSLYLFSENAFNQ